MTLDVLHDFGVTAEEGPGGVTTVTGPPRAPARPLAVEPDASSAAVALAAACLSGGRVEVPGLTAGSRQGDVAIAAHLAALGCRVESGAAGLAASGRPQRGGSFDLADQPDLAPVLAALALAVPGRTRLAGLASLDLKESPRLDVLRGALEACGCGTASGGEDLVVERPPELPAEPLALDPRGDHRMAFAFALMGLVRPNLDVLGPGCVAKSWPRFWEDLEGLGARVVRSA
jgi:3-phosphoshikimate 1-carboxyvinyltransferase